MSSSVTESHCFAEAHLLCRPQRPTSIVTWMTEEEYLEHAVAHMRGVRHPADSEEHDDIVYNNDPIGNSIRTLSIKAEYEPLNVSESNRYRDFLVCCMRGENAVAEAQFDQIRGLRAPALDPTQIVATIAARKVNADLLKFAFARGAEMNRDLAVAIKKGLRKKEGVGQYFAELLSKALEVSPLDDRGRTRPRIYPPGFDPGNRFDDINW